MSEIETMPITERNKVLYSGAICAFKPNTKKPELAEIVLYTVERQNPNVQISAILKVVRLLNRSAFEHVQ